MGRRYIGFLPFPVSEIKPLRRESVSVSTDQVTDDYIEII